MPTPLRRFRCPDDLWAQASERARAEGTSVSEVIVAGLRRYVGKPVPTAARAPSVRGTEKMPETVQGRPLRSARQDCPPEGFTPQKPDSQRCVCGLTIKHHLGGVR